MSQIRTIGIGYVLAALFLASSQTFVAGQAKKTQQPHPALNATGEKLRAKYADMLSALQKEVAKSLPNVDETKKAAFLKSCQDEMTAFAAEKKILQATTAKGAKKEELAIALKSAQQTLVQSRAESLKTATVLLKEVDPFLAGDSLDPKIVKCAVLTNATPRGLAEFAQQGPQHEALVEKLLADNALMKEMLVAGGAEAGKYGQAMEIFAAIQKASPLSHDGLLRRVALATALEHAVPIPQNNPVDDKNAPATVDPVKRYLHYEKAHLANELDRHFKDLTTWEYRMVVNSDAPDHLLTWGREMLRNYRPDHITTSNDGWRYAILVKTDVLYGSKDVKDDLPSLQAYQNICKNGGVCGRRAFFGRFIVRSFGIPVWGVTQHAHAAVGRWTPKGWVVNLGAGWNWSWWDKGETPRSGVDFLLETQARKVPGDYLKVLRAQWIADALGEKDFNDRRFTIGGFWNDVAQYRAREIAAASKAVELAPLGKDVAESNESKEVVPVQKVRATDADRKIVVGKDGAIKVPAVALKKADGKAIIAMNSDKGGMQLHCSRDLKADQNLEYSLEVPQAGKYMLVARVVTLQSDQKLLLKANGASDAVEIAVPYTVGRWEQTAPVEVALAKGQNTLRFTRPAPSRGLTIKEFTLTPVK